MFNVNGGLYPYTPAIQPRIPVWWVNEGWSSLIILTRLWTGSLRGVVSNLIRPTETLQGHNFLDFKGISQIFWGMIENMYIIIFKKNLLFQFFFHLVPSHQK